MNAYSWSLGLGIFHAGVELHGTEWAYGGHPVAQSGIFSMAPRDVDALGPDFALRQSLVLGTTAFSAAEVEEAAAQMGADFRGDRYHLLQRNCNHFADALARLLVGRGIPAWVNRLAVLALAVPFLERCLPSDFLTPVALQAALHADKDD